jgi:BirA family biotin operon repressor/biotin-[acetyl-CoA-carboxylase] ligase
LAIKIFDSKFDAPGRFPKPRRILRVMAAIAETWAGVRALLEGTRFADVRVFDEVDSTNQVVLDEAAAGAPEGLVVVAEHQRAGRGRLGRTWVSPPGGSLLVSVLLRPDVTAEQLHLVTMAAGISIAAAVSEVARVDAVLKWPNDVLVDDRKLAGVLVEVDIAGDGTLRAVVLGVGVNVNWDTVPHEIAAIATACNLEAGRPVSRADLLVAFLRGLEHRLRALDAVAAEYRGRLGTLGRQVRVELADGPLVGRAVDVDHAGRLLVEVDSGCIVDVAAGDVVHLRTTTP